MAISAYTKTTWANSPSTTTPTSAANLQHIEDQVKDITDAAVSGGASPTKIWTSTNDGNSGQPPAPKPRSGIGAGQWNYAASNLLANGLSGGTYAYLAFGTSGEFVGADAGAAQGINLSTVFGVTIAKHFYFCTTQ